MVVRNDLRKVYKTKGTNLFHRKDELRKQHAIKVKPEQGLVRDHEGETENRQKSFKTTSSTTSTTKGQRRPKVQKDHIGFKVLLCSSNGLHRLPRPTARGAKRVSAA